MERMGLDFATVSCERFLTFCSYPSSKFQNLHQCSKTLSKETRKVGGKGKIERGAASVDNYAQRRALQLPGCVAYARACEKQTIERLARSYGNGTSWKRHGDEKFDDAPASASSLYSSSAYQFPGETPVTLALVSDILQYVQNLQKLHKIQEEYTNYIRC